MSESAIMDAIGINPSSNKESKMPQVTLIERERGLRGKGNKDAKVKFQAINEADPRPDLPMDAAMQLVNGDLQEFWDRFVIGFNEMAYEAVADPIAEYIDSSWDDERRKAFRLSVNSLSKFTGKEKAEVAEMLRQQMG